MEVEGQPVQERSATNLVIYATNTSIKLLHNKVEMDGFGGGSVVCELKCQSENQRYTFVKVSEADSSKVVIGQQGGAVRVLEIASE